MKPQGVEGAIADLEKQRVQLLRRCEELEAGQRTLQEELDAALARIDANDARTPERLAQTEQGRMELATIFGKSFNMTLFFANADMRAELKNKETLTTALGREEPRVPALHAFLSEATRATGHGITTATTLRNKQVRVRTLEDDIIAARDLNTPAPIPTAAAAVAYQTTRSRTVVEAFSASTSAASYPTVKELVDEKLPPSRCT